MGTHDADPLGRYKATCHKMLQMTLPIGLI